MSNPNRARPVLMPLVLALLLIGFAASCSDDDDDGYGNGGGGGTPAANQVWIQGNAFNPGNRTVSVGTTVTWTNKDGIAHTVTSNTGAFGSGNMGNNATFSFTFSTAGSYPYHCA